jgi:hypothetical protein
MLHAARLYHMAQPVHYDWMTAIAGATHPTPKPGPCSQALKGAMERLASHLLIGSEGPEDGNYLVQH